MVTVGLSLALGARGSATLVRAGAKAARVQARFDAPRRRGGVGRGRRGRARADGGRRRQERRADRRPDRDRVGARRPRRRARRGPRAAPGPAAPRVGHPDGVPRPVRGRRAPRGARRPTARCSTGCATRGSRPSGSARPPATGSASSTSSRTRCARSRRSRRSPARPRPSRPRRRGSSHVERLIDEAGSAEAVLAGDEGARRRARRPPRTPRRRPRRWIRRPAGSPSGRGALAAEAAELARDLRDYREGLAADPARLQEVRERVAGAEGVAPQVR